MSYRFNPYRATLFVLFAAACFLYRWTRSNVRLGRNSISLEELHPNHGVAVLAILCITVVGLFKLWRNSR